MFDISKRIISIFVLFAVLLVNITVFSVAYLSYKKKINEFEQISELRRQTFTFPSSDLLRRTIENDHRYFTLLGFSNMQDPVKRDFINTLIRETHITLTNSTEYRRFLSSYQDGNEDRPAVGRIVKEIDDELIPNWEKRYDAIQSKTVALSLKMFDFDKDDIDTLLDPHIRIDRTISNQIFSKIKPYVTALSWEEITVIRHELISNLRILTQINSEISEELRVIE
tara:strand:+ start:549 stop:1223 length:675 start_codon:yes stop_codon:yes gene_type:complete